MNINFKINKMKITIVNVCFLVLSLGIFSCSGNSSSEKNDSEVVKNVEIIKSFEASQDALGKEFTMNGNFRTSQGVFAVKNGKISMGFNVGEQQITLDNINFGENKSNSMWFPEDFTDEKVKIFDKNNIEGTINDTYKVTFKVSAAEIEEPPKMDYSGIATKEYEERKAKNELKVISDFDLIEFEKVQ